MEIPQVYGDHNRSEFFIFSACDSKYFDQFAIPLAKSIQINSKNQIHLHIFNPRQDQLDLCQHLGISVTFEHVNFDVFKTAEENWTALPIDPTKLKQYQNINAAMEQGRSRSLSHDLEKTYYACARFIRLSEMLSTTQSVLAIDIDAVVRKPVPVLSKDVDLFIHRIEGRKARFLAGGICINNLKFLQEYAELLKQQINSDYFYWGMDQDLLEDLVPKYNFSKLPAELIDWDMKDCSVIWTAKGDRKNREIFKNEQTKYRF